MKTLLVTLVLGTAWTSLASADSAESATKPPHEDCAVQAQAQELDGAALKSFMKTCLAGSVASVSSPLSQRDKMRKCNADAHGMKGTERRQFMSGCLSKKTTG